MKKQITTNYTDAEFRLLVREEVKQALSEDGNEAAKDDFINITKASEILDLSKSTIYKLVGSNKIKFYKQGRKKLLFKVDELKAWLKQTRNVDINGTSPDGWNERLQKHVIFEQPPGDWIKDNWV